MSHVRHGISATLAAIAVLATSGCGGDEPASPTTVTKVVTQSADQPPASQPTTQAPAPQPTTAAPPAPTTTTQAPAPAAASWTMPDMTGMILQAAQDSIQALTSDQIFYTSSTDATGQGRHQVVDSNWKVCSQTPPAGTTIDKNSKIDFQVVKLEETC